jgi:hypothetical protein
MQLRVDLRRSGKADLLQVGGVETVSLPSITFHPRDTTH